MHIVGSNRHCDYIMREKVSPEASNSAANIEHIPDVALVVQLTIWKVQHLRKVHNVLVGAGVEVCASTWEVDLVAVHHHPPLV